jgi:hypothetical protein
MTGSTAHRYRPHAAGWIGLASANRLVAADLAEEDSRVAVLEALMASGAAPAILVGVLTAEDGTIAASFVVVDLSSGDVLTAFAARRVDQSLSLPDVSETISATTVIELDALADLENAVEPAPARRMEAAPHTDASSGYRHLFGETFIRSVEEAAIRDEPSADVIDDETRVGVDLEAARAARRTSRRSSAPPPAPTRFLELPSGALEPLDRTIIVGRSPSAERASADNIPRLISVDTPDQQLSRNHAQIAVEGGTVLVTDLHSRNGTLIVLPGKPPQQLRAGEPTPVVVGTTIDLGDGATLVIRDGS